MPKAVQRPRHRASNASGPRRRSGRDARAQNASASGRRGQKHPFRRLVFSGVLFGGLGITTALLSLLSPTPLTPDVSGRLFASGEVARSPETGPFEPIFRTRKPVHEGAWTAIFIHHSNTTAGDAASLADSARARGITGPPDHFVIGNGDGMDDGEVQFTPRWNEQAPAAPPAAGVRIERQCISICLIGDFDRARPTVLQQQRLEQLLEALDYRLKLPPDRVISLVLADSPGGMGQARRP